MQRIVVKCGRIYRSIPRSVNSSVTNYNKSVPRLQYSTTTPTIGSKVVTYNRDDRLSEGSVLKRNVVLSSEAKNTNQIESIEYFDDQNIIQINFSDGQTVNFNTHWLRDSCNCEDCVHPLTKTKLINSADISDDLFVDQIDCYDYDLEIRWKSGINDEHISQYSINWLKMFVDIFRAYPKSDAKVGNKSPNDGIYAPTVPLPPRVLWKSNEIDRQKMSTNYNEFMNSKESLKNFLEVFSRFGIAFLNDVPIHKKAILSVARRIAYERQTSYGSTFDVTFKADPKTHIANTGALLESHVDLPYRERSPGAQMLHCLEQASTGGASTLVDGIKCAESLRETDSELFAILTEFPVLFSFCDKEKGIWFREKWPIIALEPNHSIKEIHYNRVSMRPPLLPLHVMDKFYKAYRKLTALVRDNSFVYRFFLRPGDLVIFNNRRVLHGRDGFDQYSQNRHLMGCYMDLDEVMALYEKLSHS